MSGLKERLYNHRWLLLVFVFGFAIRLYACMQTHIINPDGAIYIHEARSLYYGDTTGGPECNSRLGSIYPLLIVAMYTILGNWIVAAQSVSLFFGVLILIPTFFLVRVFFNDAVSTLVTFVVSSIPVFVGRSADIVREPVFWFFIALGLYLFVIQIRRNKNGLLLLSSVSFILAASTRVEGMLFLIVSCLFIACFETRKCMKLLLFLTPNITLGGLMACGIFVTGVNINLFEFLSGLKATIAHPLGQYRALRESLRILAMKHDGNLLYFLPEVRTNIWLVALGTLLNRIVEGFFYPAFFFLVIGLSGLWKKLIVDKKILYISFLSVATFCLLYWHTMRYWMMYYRFTGVMIFPCLFFIGVGIERFIENIQRKTKWQTSTVFALTVSLVLFATLPKNLQARGADKAMYREIGEIISKRETASEVIRIATAPQIHRWASFYANLAYPGAPCPEPDHKDRWDLMDLGAIAFVERIRSGGYRYVVWEEKIWKSDEAVLMESTILRELKRWSHPDSGQLILFEVM